LPLLDDDGKEMGWPARPGVPDRRKAANGVVLYSGPSVLDGKPVVCVAVGLAHKSKNAKTGDLIQTYVLPGDESPVDALRSGADEAVCGQCPHRPQVQQDGTRKLGSCYVSVWQAPQTVWRAFRSGRYPAFDPIQHLPLFQGRAVRLGAYGDPAAVPLAVWDGVTSVAANWTGYTHQWRTCDRRYARVCMASCETVEDRRAAKALGYRTFRVRLPEEALDEGEFVCPASEEAGHRLTCETCKACSGAKGGGRNASPVIVVHGHNWKARAYREVMGRLGAGRDREGNVL